MASTYISVEFKDGDAYPLKLIPIGTNVCFLEFFPGKGGQIARSAGNYCTLTKKTETKAILTVTKAILMQRYFIARILEQFLCTVAKATVTKENKSNFDFS